MVVNSTFIYLFIFLKKQLLPNKNKKINTQTSLIVILYRRIKPITSGKLRKYSKRQTEEHILQ
jgi:hypothetical protein